MRQGTIIVEFSDRTAWSIPIEVIAENRAQAYIEEFDGDLQRSLEEDTWPLFESDSDEIFDWARNNMTWADVEGVAEQVEVYKYIANYNYEWTNAPMEIREA